ncbi:unnamed protein product [Kluyveromyces dobzhanskii CBS 2104]|uniref:Pre-rRNA-processing protein ESF2 n=1 Tax=Kluyveromyces dobzhanskii CBS 2104 TaxID=1427455 RepID=A0A0A8L5I6_9SACH|nr:unnamed protein product [Kluyveromyces dobzhanskii CBS 2104]
MSKEYSDADDFSSDEEENQVLLTNKSTKNAIQFDQLSEEEHSGSDREIPDGDEEVSSDEEAESPVVQLTEEQIEKEKQKRLKKLKSDKKSKHKTGVVYLSRIPPYMKPAKLRQILTRFGEVDRLFLKREEEHKHQQRVKGGGNKKTMFEEGWAEFIRKKDAKLCAATLNGNIVGGKKGGFYHDDVMNIKYLPGFKWADLTEQIARENDIRQAKLQLEISQANKLNAEFIQNVERSKMVNKIKQSKKRDNDGLGQVDEEVRRTFKQRKVASTRAAAPESQKQSKSTSETLDNVMHSLF